MDLELLGRYVAAVLPGCSVETRRDFFTHHLARFTEEQRVALGEELLAKLADAQVDNLAPPGLRQYEPARDPSAEGWGEVFLAPALQALLRLLVPEDEGGPGDLHLVLTNLRLAIWPTPLEELRQITVVFGPPTLLSLPGLREALAPPREYQFLRTQMAMLGLEEGLEELEERFGPQMLSESDARLNEVLQGSLLQALFQRLWGESACADPDCRLYVASCQEELLAAQTGPDAGLCARHQAWLRELGGAPERA